MKCPMLGDMVYLVNDIGWSVLYGKVVSLGLEPCEDKGDELKITIKSNDGRRHISGHAFADFENAKKYLKQCLDAYTAKTISDAENAASDIKRKINDLAS